MSSVLEEMVEEMLEEALIETTERTKVDSQRKRDKNLRVHQIFPLDVECGIDHQENIIDIGSDTYIRYITKILARFHERFPTIIVRGRGHYISKVIAIVERTKKLFSPALLIENVQIGVEMLPEGIRNSPKSPKYQRPSYNYLELVPIAYIKIILKNPTLE